MKNQVVIALPFYKESLTRNEEISLDRCRDVLGKYPRILFGPHGVNPARYLERDPSMSVIHYDDHHFTSIMSYSALCCMPRFYEKFLDYEYMLIYQLDSYVFRDELLLWCGQGFDYIGAPWPEYEHMTESKKAISRLPFLKLILKRAGQGGFTLRKVRTMFEASARLSFFRFLTRKFPEDVLWTTIGSRLYHPFRLAGFEESLKFAFDANPGLCFDLAGQKLPFGCHGWDGKYAAFWKGKVPVIQ